MPLDQNTVLDEIGQFDQVGGSTAPPTAVGDVAMPTAHGKKKSGLSMEISFLTKKVSRKDLMHFSRQLAVFVRAGVPILDALETMGEEVADKKLKAAVIDVAEGLRSGLTFSDSAARHPEAFPDFYMAVLRSAELTGNLDIVLDQLANYIERDVEAKSKVKAALVYPMLTMVMAVITVTVLTTFVLPRFEKFFKSLHAQLPLATRMLLNTTHWLGDWWWLLIATFVLAGLGLVFGVRTPRGRNVRDLVMLKAPLLGMLVRDSILERFCRILAALVTAGVPLPEALSVATEATNNSVYRSGLTHARQEMLRGEGLARPLASTGLFPAAARQMFRVGEDTGTLDNQLGAAAAYFDRELDYRIKNFTSMFEPAIIIVVGIVVGFVALALISAMYGIFNQVKV
jgi:type IV pilus assembly protein PilC